MCLPKKHPANRENKKEIYAEMFEYTGAGHD